MAIQEINITSQFDPDVAYVYRLEGVTQEQALYLATNLFCNPVTEQYYINQFPNEGEVPLEIGYKPGVMDPAEETIIYAAKNLGIDVTNVSTSRLYLSKSKPRISQVEQVINEKPHTLSIDRPALPVEVVNVRDLSSEQLIELSRTRSLFLNLEEMETIQNFARNIDRDLTDVEVETFAQTWSEHNGHKTMKANLVDEGGNEHMPLMQMIKETSKKYFDKVGVVSAFHDNAGGIYFYKDFVILIKGETHNSPVAVEPYGGAETKNGGVYRDIAGFGKGGQNVGSLMINCFIDPRTPVEQLPEGVLPPDYLLLENSRGERDYGNRMGIPTQMISLHFHPDFLKVVSMGIALGIIPERFAHKETPLPGDLLISVGGKTGRDGIHGATFSSGEMTSETATIHSTAVQLGNAIEEKRVFDALIECRNAGLIRSMTDCGGGGYSSAIGEIGEESGVEVHLDRVPLKYQGLSPWEIWLSESQERMILATSPENLKEFQMICQKYGVTCIELGKFTGDKTLTLKFNSEIVGRIPMDFLHHGLPQRRMLIKKPHREENKERIPWFGDKFGDMGGDYKKVLAHLNIASVEPMLRQYDNTVRAGAALGSFVGVHGDCPTDAAVLTPLEGEKYGMVVAHACNPILNRLDPYWGGVWAGALATSKFVAAGGNLNRAAINDNFVFPFPDPETLYDLQQSTKALCDVMNALEVPCVSGKDSLSGTFRKKDGTIVKIPPVLNVTIFGAIDDVEKTVSHDIKNKRSSLCFVGLPDLNSLGGSVHFQTQGYVGSRVPQVDLDLLPKTLKAMQNAIASGKILSCKAIGEGGIGAALAQMCFGGDCGAWIELVDLHVNYHADRASLAFFNETPGTFLIEVENPMEVEEYFPGIPFHALAFAVQEKVIRVHNCEFELLRQNVDELMAVQTDQLKVEWQKPLREIFHAS